MKQTERLFIAAELPENMVRTLKHTAHSLGLRGKARLSRPENYHVTLAFLGLHFSERRSLRVRNR